MRGNRREILVLIEQQPRRVSELATLTNMTRSAVYEALRQFKALGVIVARSTGQTGTGHAPQKVYARPDADLSAFA